MAVKGKVDVVDVTGTALTLQRKSQPKGKQGESKVKAQGSSDSLDGVRDGDGDVDTAEGPTTLPKNLKQMEIRVPGEDKDIMAYYYLLKVNYVLLFSFFLWVVQC